MKEKRGISDVITTVLMILLVIAAIAIIWVVIANFLKQGTEGIPDITDCISTSLQVREAYKVNDTLIKVVVERTQGTRAMDSLIVYIDGNLKNATGVLSAGEYRGFDIPVVDANAKIGKQAETAAVFNGKICPKSLPSTIKASAS